MLKQQLQGMKGNARLDLHSHMDQRGLTLVAKESAPFSFFYCLYSVLFLHLGQITFISPSKAENTIP